MSNALRPDDAAEYNRLVDALPLAIERARQLLAEFGDGSAAYLAADKEVSRILARISELHTASHRGSR